MSYNKRPDLGQATMANSEPVVVASDQSAIPVTDNSGSLTVDNAGTFAVQAAQSGTWNVTNVSGTVSLPTGASTLAEQQTQTTALQLIDNIVLAEDAAHVSGDAGVQLLTVRTNTAAARSGTDGDYQPLITDTNGRLHVTSSSNETTTKEVVGDAAIDAAISGNPVLIAGRASTATPTAMSADNDVQALWLTRNGALNIADAGGSITVDGTVGVSGTVTVDGSGVTQPVSAASLPLPTGAATAANQSTIIGHVDGIEGLLTTIDADTGNLPTIETNTNFGTVTGGGTETGALRVTIANNSTGVVSVDDNGGSLTVDGTVTANLAAGTNNIGDVDVASIAAGTNIIGKTYITDGTDDATIRDVTGAKALDVAIVDGSGNQITSFGGGTQYAVDGALGSTPTGTVALAKVDAALSALTPVDGDAESLRVDANGALHMNMSYKLDSTNDRIGVEAITSGGATPYKLNSAASTNATSVKGSAGQVYSIMATNTNAAVRYLKLYNKASAPTVGTDTPVQVYALPGATTGGGFSLNIPVGMVFSTGIAFATTTGAADSDTGAVAANEIIVNLTYK